ncbi:hypothetical protein [Haloarchaeobius amylolyticus]|uniref:hypothetical protein n=1 Tax=Haloarchaeobius amylolyticus TaxID=1198296 RepID=UPI00226F4757|nr:hypothetical protein [Haloarchaeobius amylolyticus]
MSAGPSLRRSLFPLLFLAWLLPAWLSPPDPFSQLLWLAPSVALALVLGVWFARHGHQVLDASVRDLWVFAVTTLGVVILGVLLVPDPTLSAVELALLLVAAFLLAGWLGFAPSAAPVRRRLGENSPSE